MGQAQRADRIPYRPVKDSIHVRLWETIGPRKLKQESCCTPLLSFWQGHGGMSGCVQRSCSQIMSIMSSGYLQGCLVMTCWPPEIPKAVACRARARVRGARARACARGCAHGFSHGCGHGCAHGCAMGARMGVRARVRACVMSFV